MAVDLAGVTQLEKPRVSKKVILKTLRTMNVSVSALYNGVGECSTQISRLRVDHDALAGRVTALEARSSTLENQMRSALGRLDAHDALIASKADQSVVNEIDKRLHECESQCASVAEHTAQIATLQKQRAEDRAELDGLQDSVRAELQKKDDAIVALANQVKALQEKLDKLSGDIELSSDKVLCPVIPDPAAEAAAAEAAEGEEGAAAGAEGEGESEAPAAPRQLTLTEVLVELTSAAREARGVSLRNEAEMERHTGLLDGKADVAFAEGTRELAAAATATVEQMETELQEANILSKVDPENPDAPRTGGVGELTSRMEAQLGTAMTMLDKTQNSLQQMENVVARKCDTEEVDQKIEVKYDEIIDHLQAAINSAAEDEDDFKKAAAELQETCKQLQNTKANKSDIQEMKERMMLDSKLGEEVENLRQFLDEKLGREEAQAMMRANVNRQDLAKALFKLKGQVEAMVRAALDEDGDGPEFHGGGGGRKKGRREKVKGGKITLRARGDTSGGSSRLSTPQQGPAREGLARMGPGGGVALGGGYQVQLGDGGRDGSRPGSRQAGQGTPLRTGHPNQTATLVRSSHGQTQQVGENGQVYAGGDPQYEQYVQSHGAGAMAGHGPQSSMGGGMHGGGGGGGGAGPRGQAANFGSTHVAPAAFDAAGARAHLAAGQQRPASPPQPLALPADGRGGGPPPQPWQGGGAVEQKQMGGMAPVPGGDGLIATVKTKTFEPSF